MPEALTEWRFLGFAHDRRLRSGYLEARTVTAKDLMVQPNPPRFLREGDAHRVHRQGLQPVGGPADRHGATRLQFRPERRQRRSRRCGLLALGVSPSGGSGPAPAQSDTTERRVAFDIPAGESRTCAWRVAVPDGCGFLTYKAVASTGRLSDGEEGYLPVLSRRILVTESLPLPIRGPGDEAFTLREPQAAPASPTRCEHESLTVQMVSRPGVVRGDGVAVPDGVPARVQRAGLQPALRERARPAHRQQRSEDRRRVRAVAEHAGARFAAREERGPEVGDARGDAVAPAGEERERGPAQRRQSCSTRTGWTTKPSARWRKLAEQQRATARGRGSRADPRTITSRSTSPRASAGCDTWAWTCPSTSPSAPGGGWTAGWSSATAHRRGRAQGPGDHLSSTEALYLYGRSFFLKDLPIEPATRTAVDYFLGQATEHWLTAAPAIARSPGARVAAVRRRRHARRPS